MKKILKLLTSVFLLFIQGVYTTFVVWGLATWDKAVSLVSNRTTMILLGIPILLVINIGISILIVILYMGFFLKKKFRRHLNITSGWFPSTVQEVDYEENE